MKTKSSEKAVSKLEQRLKVSQKSNRESFSQVVRRIRSLGKKRVFHYDPSDPLRELRNDHFELVSFLAEAQKGQGRDEKLRQGIRNTVESLVVNAINFHLNFFRPSFLGIPENNTFDCLLREMRATFSQKNADYGNAFRFWGVPGLLVRIGDKYFRLVQLSKSIHKRKVADERLPDTALDLANYGIMLLMLLDEGYSLKFGS